MDDQLELHLQRFLEDESEDPNEDSDLQQLLTLQSQEARNQIIGESLSLELPQSQSQESRNDIQKEESPVPLHPPVEHQMPDSHADGISDRFWRISHFVKSAFKAPNSYGEVILKLLWALPVIVVLGDYVGWIWSLQWGVLGLVILHIQQDHLMGEEVERGDSKATIDITQLAKSEHGHTTTNNSTDTVGPPVKQQVLQRQKEHEKFRDETITKVSHLLGLAGAPPLLWPLGPNQSTRSNDDLSLVDATSSNMDVEAIKNVATKVNSNQKEDPHDHHADLTNALSSLVHFCESQVQFLLTVDQALDYLRTSASIHLGLGPQSQCVERVEQAAMARMIRQHRHKPQTKNTDNDYKSNSKKGGALEPQRGTNKSVLSLVSLRRNLAQSIVHHSATLDSFWKSLYEDVGREPLLEMPHIVNLAWIKDARRVLAESLSGTVEEVILLLEEELESNPPTNDSSRIWIWLKDADIQSRQLTQYLRGTLLLPHGTVESAAMAHSIDNPNDPLFRSLMNFRTQLDALGTALWSCQQYCNSSQNTSCQANQQSTAVDKEELNFYKEDPIFLQRQWWMKIRQMSDTCRAFETEITEMYFPQEVASENGIESEEEKDNTQATRSQETGDYVHGDGTSKTQATELATKKEKTTKTVVFSGKGKVLDRPKTSGRKGKGRNGADSDGMDSGSALPLRDTVSELAMVSELQSRIKALHLEEDIEGDESDSEEQKAARLARQPAAPLFLGASGSLLSELKLSIPSIGMLNSEMGDNAGEEIIGED